MPCIAHPALRCIINAPWRCMSITTPLAVRARASSASCLSTARNGPAPVTRCGKASRSAVRPCCNSMPSGSMPTQAPVAVRARRAAWWRRAGRPRHGRRSCARWRSASASISACASDEIGQHIGGGKIGGAGKAAVEMRRDDLHAPEGEVGEAGIELRLRMAGEEAAADARIVGACRGRPARSCRARSAADAPAASPLPVSASSSEARPSTSRLAVCVASFDTRISGEPSTSVATLTSEANGMAGVAVERRQRAGAGRAQQRLGHARAA